MKSLALTLLLTLLSMPVLAEDGPQLPWVAPEVMAAAVDIGMDDAQRAEFRGAVTDLARGYMDDIRKVMSGRDQTNLKRKIKSKRNSRMKQLDKAMATLGQVDHGVLVYMRQEGRGIGLANKLKAYRLQDQGLDTVEANKALGFPADLREYGLGAQMLHYLGVRKMRLLTNNPKKIAGLAGYGLELIDQLPLEAGVNPSNIKYLRTKRDKLGHLLADVDSPAMSPDSGE